MLKTRKVVGKIRRQRWSQGGGGDVGGGRVDLGDDDDYHYDGGDHDHDGPMVEEVGWGNLWDRGNCERDHDSKHGRLKGKL